MAVIAKGLDVCLSQVRYQRHIPEVRIQRTIPQICLIRRQIIAKLALIHHDIGKRRRGTPFKRIDAGRVEQVLIESRFQRRTRHHARRRDVVHLLGISVETCCKGEAKIICNSQSLSRFPLLSTIRTHTESPRHIRLARIRITESTGQLALNAPLEIRALRRRIVLAI